MRLAMFVALALFAAAPAVAQTQPDWEDPATYEAIWAKPEHGWSELITQSKVDAVSGRRVQIFVQLKLRDAWQDSLAGNGYQPIRDLIAELYQAGEQLGPDKDAGHALLFRSAQTLDRVVRDAVPDFLYTFLRPS